MTIVIISPLQPQSGFLHLCMLSLLVLEVPTFLFAYFTIILKHGVNEVEISFYLLLAYLGAY